ncbi:MAG TPA: hypothetical protein ENJ82_08760 [Bacteroidetes bacterium]|nr:hypothetical protein [Bacteroidota bacterium]
MKIPHIGYLLLLIVLLGNTTLFSQMKPGKGLVLGEVVDTIYCTAHAGQSYALYLPKSYTPQKQWPIMYIFDPGANGAYPVRRFQKAAEAYGYILIGSNNSENGSWKNSFAAANAMFDDTWSRFSIDTGRVYTSGFSGGARVATAVAMNSGRIAGVIACGAGFPTVADYQPHADLDFAFVGIVGNLDMNFLELNQVYDKLVDWKLPAQLIEFDGRHGWPHPDTVMMAFDFLEIQAVKTGLVVADAGQVAEIRQRANVIADTYLEDGRPLDAAIFLQRMVYAWEGIADVSAEKKRRAGLLKEKKTEKMAKSRRRALVKEADLQQAYSEQFLVDFRYPDDTASTEFWKDQGEMLAKMKRSKDIERGRMANRLINQLWVRCYELGGRAQREGKHRDAARLYRTWSLVQPAAIYPFIRAAVAYLALGEKRKAIRYLERAVANGLLDPERLKISELANLKGEKKYEQLCDKLESRQKN